MKEKIIDRKRIRNISSNIMAIIIIIIAIIVYRKYDFNLYTKGVVDKDKTSFSRDSQIKYSKTRSYKLENEEQNDAMFYKKIEVKPFTPYRVTCMIKTDSVGNDENNPLAGAQICLSGTEEHSEVLTGNNDWTKVEFFFNSKCNSTVEIGFRLGGNLLKTKGTAWFSDLTLEKGVEDTSTEWNFGCFILNNIDIKLIDGSSIKQTMSEKMKNYVYNNMRRLNTSIKDVSHGKMSINYKIIEIDTPLTTISYEKDNGYYIGEKDVVKLIDTYVQNEEFDHIFVCTDLPLESKILHNDDVSEWVGLGNMLYQVKGFSNIRITENDYAISIKNTFPEEVFLHEFLHTLERNSAEYGYAVPALHDYKKYGYAEDSVDGLRKWYEDYMNKKIMNNGKYEGLPEEIYSLKPAKSKDFEYSYKLDKLDEPNTPREKLESVVYQIKRVFVKEDNVSDENKKVEEFYTERTN